MNSPNHDKVWEKIALNNAVKYYGIVINDIRIGIAPHHLTGYNLIFNRCISENLDCTFNDLDGNSHILSSSETKVFANAYNSEYQRLVSAAE